MRFHCNNLYRPIFDSTMVTSCIGLNASGGLLPPPSSSAPRPKQSSVGAQSPPLPSTQGGTDDWGDFATAFK